MSRSFLVGSVVSVLFVSSTWSETFSSDAGAITAAVDGFHDALCRGDAKAAMELLAPDAVIQESGAAETREEYEKHHLTEDIAFSRAVRSTHSVSNVRIEGNVAWVTAASHAIGSFRDRRINSIGTELMVLSKSSQGWRIRAIHWSSHDNKRGQ